jgi:hypothetical protein
LTAVEKKLKIYETVILPVVLYGSEIVFDVKGEKWTEGV